MSIATLLGTGVLALLHFTQNSRVPPPSCRKSSAVSVLNLPAQGRGGEVPSVVIWSGKGPHGPADMLEGLFAFDLDKMQWAVLQSDVQPPALQGSAAQPEVSSMLNRGGDSTRYSLPSPRWKELTATMPSASSMLMFAGDSVESRAHEAFRNDVWRLEPAAAQNRGLMFWQQGSMRGGISGADTCWQQCGTSVGVSSGTASAGLASPLQAETCPSIGERMLAACCSTLGRMAASCGSSTAARGATAACWATSGRRLCAGPRSPGSCCMKGQTKAWQ